MVQDEILKLKFDNSYGGKLFATQTDTGRTFTVQILSDRNDIIDVTGMSLRLYVGNQKEVTYCDGEIVDAGKGIFKLQLFNSQLKYPGIQQAQFILKKENKKIGSKIFDMHIEEGVEAGSSMGTNLVIMYDEIKEATEFLKDYDRTLEEAKKVDLSLKIGIKEGTDTREDLANCKKKALEIKSNLETTTTNAQNILNEAAGFKDEVENIKNTLVEENTKAGSNLTNLDAKIADGKQTATKLENKTSAAKTTQGQLEQANTAASSTMQSLEATTSAANEAKTKLDNSTRIGDSVSNDLSDKISQGGTLNSNLADNISSANSAKRNLDGSISNAESTNTNLKATDTEAKNTESLIRDLMNKLGKTKEEVQGIIASGNLDQYITDPKLQEALKSYATKEDLSKIDVTSQLVDYAKKTEIPTKLSQLNNDKTFKTETEIQTMINNSAKLKKEVVTSLPSSGKEDIIYLLKNKNDNNNFYTEYLWIGGKWEIIGDTKVDLTDYAKKSEIKTKLSDKVDKVEGKGLSTNDFTNELKAELNKVTMKDTPSADFNSVSKEGVYNGSFSSNCPNGSGKYTLFVYPTDSSTQHRENYMFQIAVKDNVDSTPYFRLRRGSTTWGKWYKYSTNDYTDSDKAKITNIPASPKYTDTVTSINGKTGAITKDDIVALGIPGQDTNTTYGLASQSSSGLMSAADKKRLDNIKEQVALTEAQYNALSSTQQNDATKIYFMKA